MYDLNLQAKNTNSFLTGRNMSAEVVGNATTEIKR